MPEGRIVDVFRDPETGLLIAVHDHPAQCPRCGYQYRIRSGAYAKEKRDV